MSTFTTKSDNRIMELLKITDLSHIIAQTSHGPLSIQLRKGEHTYRFLLDSVPVTDETHDELMELLYPPKIVVPQVNKEPVKKAFIKKNI
jgi:hypothetical protein